MSCLAHENSPGSVLAASARLSRELALVCSFSGVCREADAHAKRVLGPVSGRSLIDLADSGSREKVVAFLEQARVSPVKNWELSLAVDHKPTLFSFDSEVIG